MNKTTLTAITKVLSEGGSSSANFVAMIKVINPEEKEEDYNFNCALDQTEKRHYIHDCPGHADYEI